MKDLIVASNAFHNAMFPGHISHDMENGNYRLLSDL